jgi:aryl-alcohol dehydrogenase-like predicted oxidoreductase
MPDKKYKSGSLVRSFEDSMSRLQRSSADLYWIHVPNNLEENIMEAISLMKDGRIKALGISNVSLSHIEKAEELLSDNGLKLGAVQNHFSLLRNDQQPIIDHCRANGIDYYAYMVLEQGALSGKYSAKNHFPTFSMRNFAFPKSKFKKIEGLLNDMKELSLKYNVDQSQIPVLWAIGKGAIPIVGITKPLHAKKLFEAAEVNLTDGELDMLTQKAADTGIRQQGIWEPQ